MTRRYRPSGICAILERGDRKRKLRRISAIRVRLADGWRHMQIEARLYEAEAALRESLRRDGVASV